MLVVRKVVWLKDSRLVKLNSRLNVMVKSVKYRIFIRKIGYSMNGVISSRIISMVFRIIFLWFLVFCCFRMVW